MIWLRKCWPKIVEEYFEKFFQRQIVTIFKTRSIGKMQVFKSTEKQLADFGLYRPHPIDSNNIFNYKNVSILFLFVTVTILLDIAIFSLKTVTAFVTGYFGFSAYGTVLYCTIMLFKRAPTIYRLINDFEETIGKRE